ncbi:MAG: Pls/PosA family non-ribosomal peptide synthetase [Sporichthyaceae bacterium]
MKHNHNGPAAQGRGTVPCVLVDDRHSNAIRWTPGTRLQHLFEEVADRFVDRLAVDAATGTLTFAELDARANQLARHLLTRGAAAGMRIGLLFDDATSSYVAMLAVLKINAAYVPMDPAFPADRLAYITEDSAIGMHLTTARLAERLAHTGVPVQGLDCDAMAIDAQDPSRLRADECAEPVEDLAYVIYTSGSTGRPKGVAIEHPSICNFVAVAAECYGIEPGDRMYQGMTIAFDFSIEEIWVPWISGATLVPKPSGSALVGADLATFLTERRITALACVPTLLPTIETDLPDLRFLLVSGEACPQDLITRWYSPERRFLNVYGPTEATVSCTWAEVHPDRAVTIGVPLPTYSAVILDPDSAKALPPGELGELAIAGIGLARGYLNRDDLTAAAFVPDFLGLPENPSARIYRTGDLCRIGANREIEYHGRIDTQVKIRGYRIELTEIESVLLQAPGIAAAVVNNVETAPGSVELVAYYTQRAGETVDRDAVHELMRSHLPPYMVPSYLEELAAIPMLPSGKADRKSLPPARGPRLGAGKRPYVAPAPGLETTLAQCLTDTLRTDDPSADAHFFDELGADSLTMARFCSAVREATDRSIAMRDVYLNPTIARLAAASEEQAPINATGEDLAPADAGHARTERVSQAAYVACGAAQALTLSVGFVAMAYLALEGLSWIGSANGVVDAWQRASVFGASVFAGFTVFAVAAKWLLVGRSRPEEFPVYGRRYFRFWLSRRLMMLSPLAAFPGSPLFVWYLRLLGARIGSGALLQSSSVPACPDLLHVGAGAVVLRKASISCYRAVDGWIETGPVNIGAAAFVGESSHLDIETSLGDGARLDRASSLHRGRHVGPGERVAGVPAQPVDVPARQAPQLTCTRLRRGRFAVAQLSAVLLLFVPAATLLALLVMDRVQTLDVRRLVDPTPGIGLADPGFYLGALVVASALFTALLVLGLATVLLSTRAMRPFLRTGRTYPLYGFAYWALRRIAVISSSRFFMYLFGDSSAIVYWLQALGYRLAPVVQTGSNFGISQRHDLPWLCRVGTGTMVSDGIVFVNTEYTASSFQLADTRIGEQCYVGNEVVYPASAVTGDNCLLATRALVPTEGAVVHDTGLLGAPAFAIPRSVTRDSSVNLEFDEEERRDLLRAKNRHNLRTALAFLASRWFLLFLALCWLSLATAISHEFGLGGTVLAAWSFMAFVLGFWVALDRVATRYARLSPRVCSLLDERFWRHELYWKLPNGQLFFAFNGTPFKAWAWRATGVRVGKRLFDDGAGVSERPLLSIGDYVTLNNQVDIQGHSLEDGVFKADHIEIADGTTVGVKAFVHYGTRLEAGSMLEAHSFLMKGESVPPGEMWGCNPARRIGRRPVVVDTERHASLLADLAAPAPSFGSEVSVYAFDLAKVAEARAPLFEVLCPAEQRQAEEFAAPERRLRFVAVHALIRLLLTSTVDPGTDPVDWPLARTPLGKLILDEVHLMDVEIGVSHADDVLLLAISRSHRVGIDLEPTDRALGLDVPRFALTDSEALLFAARPVDEHADLFVRLWTIKEAVLKCTGWGMSVEPDRIAVGVDPVHATVLGDRPTTRSLEVAQHRWTCHGQDFWVALSTARARSPAEGSVETSRAG